MVQVCRSIVYGSIATPIKKPDSDHTHRWTVYVKGFHEEEIGTYIKRVVFKLHESFSSPVRSIEEPPFEVTETGWGEFQLQIRIVFQDPQQKPVQLNHHLRLYPPEEANSLLKTSKPVISEHYEELVFDPPTEYMESLLETTAGKCVDPRTSSRYSDLVSAEKAERNRLEEAIVMVKGQINELEQKLELNNKK